MRGQKHLAAQRLLGQQVVQPRRLQVARQQQFLAETFHRQHEAVGVVRAEHAAARRVQHLDRAVGAALQAVSGAERLHFHIAAFERLAQFRQQRVWLLEHDRRDVDRANCKLFQQFRQGVEVIGVGVR